MWEYTIELVYPSTVMLEQVLNKMAEDGWQYKAMIPPLSGDATYGDPKLAHFQRVMFERRK